MSHTRLCEDRGSGTTQEQEDESPSVVAAECRGEVEDRRARRTLGASGQVCTSRFQQARQIGCVRCVRWRAVGADLATDLRQWTQSWRTAPSQEVANSDFSFWIAVRITTSYGLGKRGILSINFHDSCCCAALR